MAKFKVFQEVLKVAIVEADNAKEAERIAFEQDIEWAEKEITQGPIAFEVI